MTTEAAARALEPSARRVPSAHAAALRARPPASAPAGGRAAACRAPRGTGRRDRHAQGLAG